MIDCAKVRPQLTAYLDGELEGDRGSVVRGHLRACAACRDVARDEAMLRDGLRALAPVDPPATMWAGVQQKLAAAELRDAEQPSWRRVLAHWLPPVKRFAPTFAAAALAASIGIVFVSHRSGGSRHDDGGDVAPVAEATAPRSQPTTASEPPQPPVAPAIAPGMSAAVVSPSADDVTADLALDGERTAQAFRDAADGLVAELATVHAQWSAERRKQFDAKLGELRAAVASAAGRRPRERAWRAEIRFLQTALVRDQIAINDRVYATGVAGATGRLP